MYVYSKQYILHMLSKVQISEAKTIKLPKIHGAKNTYYVIR